MKKIAVADQLIEMLEEPINEATKKLTDRRNQNKLCKYTTHAGSTDITMIVRQPPLSGGNKKSLVFEIIIWVKRFVHGTHRRLKRITEVYKLERVIPNTLFIPDFVRN